MSRSAGLSAAVPVQSIPVGLNLLNSASANGTVTIKDAYTLGLPMESVEQQFRRMAFNIIARNQDDHVKNIAFLMDRSGAWSLSPAYDVTYSYNPTGSWTATHQMTLNGKRDGFTREDFEACAKAALMKRGRAATILGEVQAAVRRWPEFAAEARLAAEWSDQIQRTHRLSFVEN